MFRNFYMLTNKISNLYATNFRIGSWMEQYRDGISEERELLQRIARRDEAALEVLYERYARLLYSVILAMLKHPPDAQDLLQEVFIQIWNNAGSFDPTRGTAYSWLVALTRNRAIDKLRSKSFREQRQADTSLDGVLEHPDGALTPLDATVVLERAGIVRTALSQLSTGQREALEMAYFQGYTQSEIAEQLQTPLGTVKTRMRQGLQKLHDILQKQIQYDHGNSTS